MLHIYIYILIIKNSSELVRYQQLGIGQGFLYIYYMFLLFWLCNGEKFPHGIVIGQYLVLVYIGTAGGPGSHA